MTTEEPPRARSAAAAWCSHGAGTPRCRSRSTSSGGTHAGQSAVRPTRRGTCSTWVMRSARVGSRARRPSRVSGSGTEGTVTAIPSSQNEFDAAVAVRSPGTPGTAPATRKGSARVEEEPSGGPTRPPSAAWRRAVDLSLSTRTEGDRTVVVVGGEIDVYTAPKLREQLIDLVSSGQYHLVVDMEGVEFLDSTGLGVLVGGLKRVRAHEGSLRLVCTQERILKIFRITGLTKVFPIHASVDEAVAATD